MLFSVIFVLTLLSNSSKADSNCYWLNETAIFNSWLSGVWWVVPYNGECCNEKSVSFLNDRRNCYNNSAENIDTYVYPKPTNGTCVDDSDISWWENPSNTENQLKLTKSLSYYGFCSWTMENVTEVTTTTQSKTKVTTSKSDVDCSWLSDSGILSAWLGTFWVVPYNGECCNEESVEYLNNSSICLASTSENKDNYIYNRSSDATCGDITWWKGENRDDYTKIKVIKSLAYAKFCSWTMRNVTSADSTTTTQLTTKTTTSESDLDCGWLGDNEIFEALFGNEKEFRPYTEECCNKVAVAYLNDASNCLNETSEVIENYIYPKTADQTCSNDTTWWRSANEDYFKIKFFKSLEFANYCNLPIETTTSTETTTTTRLTTKTTTDDTTTTASTSTSTPTSTTTTTVKEDKEEETTTPSTTQTSTSATSTTPTTPKDDKGSKDETTSETSTSTASSSTRHSSTTEKNEDSTSTEPETTSSPTTTTKTKSDDNEDDKETTTETSTTTEKDSEKTTTTSQTSTKTTTDPKNDVDETTDTSTTLTTPTVSTEETTSLRSILTSSDSSSSSTTGTTATTATTSLNDSDSTTSHPSSVTSSSSSATTHVSSTPSTTDGSTLSTSTPISTISTTSLSTSTGTSETSTHSTAASTYSGTTQSIDPSASTGSSTSTVTSNITVTSTTGVSTETESTSSVSGSSENTTTGSTGSTTSGTTPKLDEGVNTTTSTANPVSTTIRSTTNAPTTIILDDGRALLNVSVEVFDNCTTLTQRLLLNFTSNQLVLNNTRDPIGCLKLNTSSTAQGSTETATTTWPVGGTTRIMANGDIILHETLTVLENCTTILEQVIFTPSTGATRKNVEVDPEGCLKLNTTTAGTGTTPLPSGATTELEWQSGGTTRILSTGEIVLQETLTVLENCTTILVQTILNPTTKKIRNETTSDAEGCKKLSTESSTTTATPGSATTTYNWPTGGTTRTLPSGEIILSETLTAYDNCTTVLMQLILNPVNKTTRTEVTSDAEGCKSLTTSASGTPGTTQTTQTPGTGTTTYNWPTGGTTRTLPSGEIILSEILTTLENCTTVLLQKIYNPADNTTRTVTTTDADGCNANTSTASPSGATTPYQNSNSSTVTSAPLNATTPSSTISTVSFSKNATTPSTISTVSLSKNATTVSTTTTLPAGSSYCSKLNLDLTNSQTPASAELTNSSSPGTKIVHSCKPNYVFSIAKMPLKIFSCLKTGVWSGTPETCVLEKEL